MKKTLILTLVILATSMANVLQACAPMSKSLRGSEQLVTRDATVDPFDAIVVERGIEVILVPGKTSEPPTLHIEINENLSEELITETRNGCLYLTFSSQYPSLSNIHAVITVPVSGPIKRIEARSSAEVTTRDVQLRGDVLDLKATSAAELDLDAHYSCVITLDLNSAAELTLRAATDKCIINASSAADLDLTLTAAHCSIDASSAASVELNGQSDRCNASLSSAASLKALQFETAESDISVSSGASAKIFCTQHLRAKASSGGSIRYTGDCTVEPHIALGGSLSKK